MVTSKLEVLVELGKEGEASLQSTIKELQAQKGVKQAIFKDGAIMVETSLPSTQILDMVTKTSGRRAVLQGFGDTQSAVAMVSSQSCCDARVLGVVRFQQSTEGPLVVDGSIDGLAPGPHGLRVHEAGDLSRGCASIGPLYNPVGASLGAPDSRPAGDLGNVQADCNGRATFRIVDNVLKVWDMIGRSVAVTDRMSDLGTVASPAANDHGDSAKPIACGIIARSAGIFENAKRICACDGVVVWDERDRPIAGKGRRDTKRCCQKDDDKIKGVKPCCRT